ncbi:MAG: 1,4-alpha-glucan branching protein GlgB [Leptolyngbya sp. PLA3]|nr:MAG: 1,4-alpha-glucan branching protein GlgB [Cyanobacteria bacterium CYA]MCE7968206.1 1,4-alpha-glucan branching protein GlgB [Leptolyngbya sp. PL-A3]
MAGKPRSHKAARAVAAARAEAAAPSRPGPFLSADDVYLFNEGTHSRLYQCLGAHMTEQDGRGGVHFAVWAPNAERVSVVGPFNGWTPGAHPMHPLASSGVWTAFIPDLREGTLYKYHIESGYNLYRVDKADPFGFAHEPPPGAASLVATLDYQWNDADWMAARAASALHTAPVSIYEVHLGSWRHAAHGQSLSYRQLADALPPYVRDLGFTHVEFLPVMEHPLYRSWGYQTTGYFAPTGRFGPPQDFMLLIDRLHQAGIGVILDWVPSHFPSDEHALGYFDGTHLFEHADPRQGFHPDWKSLIFNYGRNEVRSFLLSSACFWLDKYHADALRVDAVASMLYLDYSRPCGQWIPNPQGGRENTDAINFLRQFHTEVYRSFPGVQTFAEESTAWPGVSRPVHENGLGFGFKWDMGWMHDTLRYLSFDPVHRKAHHNDLTFRGLYMFAENYTLPLSHDEVVHGKGSLYGRMPGDDWQKRANLRLLLAGQWTQPGKKLLFMGGEFAQHREWNHDAPLDWPLLEQHGHAGIQRLVEQLNRLYRQERSLHELDHDREGFLWLVPDEADLSVAAYLRRGADLGSEVVCVFNFTPVLRHGFCVGVPWHGVWREILNTDALEFGGSGAGNLGLVRTRPIEMHEQPYSVPLTLPPLAAVLLRHDPQATAAEAH